MNNKIGPYAHQSLEEANGDVAERMGRGALLGCRSLVPQTRDRHGTCCQWEGDLGRLGHI